MKKLTQKQKTAIPLLLEAPTIAEGAEKARITRATFYNWLKEAAFREELQTRQDELISFALTELRASGCEAVAVLRDLMKSSDERIRLKAATDILNHISKFRPLDDIEQCMIEIDETFL